MQLVVSSAASEIESWCTQTKTCAGGFASMLDGCQQYPGAVFVAWLYVITAQVSM